MVLTCHVLSFILLKSLVLFLYKIYNTLKGKNFKRCKYDRRYVKGLTNNVGMGSSEFHVLRCGDKINNKYLFSYLNRNIIRKEAEQNMTGASGHRRVPITFYENLDIPLSSIETQQKIVAEIEKNEKNILDAQNKIDDLEKYKKNILSKYL